MPEKCLQYFKKEPSIEKKLKFYNYILKCLAHYLEGKSQLSGSFPKDKCVFILDHSMWPKWYFEVHCNNKSSRFLKHAKMKGYSDDLLVMLE